MSQQFIPDISTITYPLLATSAYEQDSTRRGERGYHSQASSSSGLLSTRDIQIRGGSEVYSGQVYEDRNRYGFPRSGDSNNRDFLPSLSDSVSSFRQSGSSSRNAPQLALQGSSPYTGGGPSSSTSSIASPFAHHRPLRSPHPPLSAGIYGSRGSYGYPQYDPSQSPYELLHSPLSVASQSRRSSLAESQHYPPPPLHLASLHPAVYQHQLQSGLNLSTAYPPASSSLVRSSPLGNEYRDHYPIASSAFAGQVPPPHLPPLSSISVGSSHIARPPSSSSSIASAYHHFPSPSIPFQAPLPQPLRFDYTSASPTGSTSTIMPPRKKPTSSAMSVTHTPGTVSSTGTGAGSAPQQGNGWKTERIMTDNGRPQEVIVLEDTHSPAPPPIPKKRTRAQAALEAAQSKAQANGLNGSTSTSASVTAGSAKKRKVDDLASSVGSSASKKGKVKATGSTKGAGSTASQATHYQPPYQTAAAVKPLPAAPAVAAHVGPAWDDKEGHYIIKPDEMVDGRFKIIRLLGQGTFGKVVECRDVLTRRKVAIKIIRAVQKYRDASKIEVRVLQTLKQADTQNLYKCIHMDEYFDFRNHPCIVSELLGMSVFDFLKENRFQPFPERHIQDFARSLLTSVSFLHRLKLVHTDLKPENILLAENGYFTVGPRAKASRAADAPKTYNVLRNTDIRLIDFGSATFENEYHSTVVSTRHYRAPEIILGLSWSYPCDLFSIGCILVEFFTGDALFQTHDNLEHLAMMEVVMGKMPARIMKAGNIKKPEFFRGNGLDFPNAQTPKSSKKFVKGLQPLHKIITPGDATNNLFLDLVVRLLDFDPQRRITVDQALAHPYFKQHIPAPEPPSSASQT